ncbi:hypothetical protein D3C81_853880 [compost metagenome]
MKYYLLTFSVSAQVLTKRTELINYLGRHIADLKYISADLQDKLCTITIRTLKRDEGVVLNLLAIRGFKVLNGANYRFKTVSFKTLWLRFFSTWRFCGNVIDVK